MKKWTRELLLALFLIVAYFFVLPEHAQAAQWYDIVDNDDDQDEFYEGDTQEKSLNVYYGARGKFLIPKTWKDHSGKKVKIVSAEFETVNSWNDVITINKSGSYKVTGIGSAEAEGRFYDASGRLLLTRTYDITSKVNMKGSKLNKTSATSYVQKGQYFDFVSSQFQFRLKRADHPLPMNSGDYEVSCTSSNPDMYVSAYMSDKRTIIIDVSGSGKTTVTLVINEKKFKVRLSVTEVGINRNSLLLYTKQTRQLRVSGVKKGVKWRSSRPGVVKVTSDGKVKGLRTGNAVIKARVGDITLGCAVSVVSPARYKTICQAVRIGKNCTYSQDNRMKKGYYDCSSLTWMAYKRSGINFGDRYYAPVAANQAKWCMKRKKYVKGGLSASNIQNMKLNAGDLMFEEGDDNGRYRNIYHVEMIKGYICYGFDENGRPILGITWANRPDDYYWADGQLVCRP